MAAIRTSTMPSHAEAHHGFRPPASSPVIAPQHRRSSPIGKWKQQHRLFPPQHPIRPQPSPVRHTFRRAAPPQRRPTPPAASAPCPAEYSPPYASRQQHQPTFFVRQHQFNNSTNTNGSTQQTTTIKSGTLHSIQPQQNNGNNFGTFCPSLGKCQLCSVHGHSARLCPQFQVQSIGQSSARSDRPQAHLAPSHSNSARFDSSTPNWLLDSGASHHVTSDLQNLLPHSPYTGIDDIIVGDENEGARRIEDPKARLR